MEYTADKIENEITLLSPFLKIISMFHIHCWYNKGNDDQNKVENIAIRCNNCEKQNVLSMKSININYRDIIRLFVLNNVLHLVFYIMDNKNKKNMEYDMDKHTSD